MFLNFAFGSLSRPEAHGGDVAVLMKLLAIKYSSSERAPLSAFRKDNVVKVCHSREATRTIRQFGDRTCSDSKQISIHSLRRGTATVVAVWGEIAAREIQADGRWKSGSTRIRFKPTKIVNDPVAVSRRPNRARKLPHAPPGHIARWGEHRTEPTGYPRDGSICMVCRSIEMMMTALSTSPASILPQEMPRTPILSQLDKKRTSACGTEVWRHSLILTA